MTRPDISYAAHQFTNFSENQGGSALEGHQKGITVLNMGLPYVGVPGGNTKLSAWVDTGHGTFPDTRCSISAGVAMMGKVSNREGENGSVIRIGICGALRDRELASIVRQLKEFMASPIDENIRIFYQDNKGRPR